MTVIRRIRPSSAFKVGFMIHAFIGLILGGICTLATAVGMHSPDGSMFGISCRHICLFAVIFCPILYGIIGGVGAVVWAAVYNLISGWIGGLEVDLA